MTSLSFRFLLAVRTLVRAAALPVFLASGSIAAAQTSQPSDPPTRNQQLRSLLGLGDAAGCTALLRLEDFSPVTDETLVRLGPELGPELRAICTSSAVTSASSLGGTINSLQATKTVAQHRLVRKRIDQRRAVRSGAKPSRDLFFALAQQPASPALTSGRELATGVGVFGEIELEWRDRVDTERELGFESDVTGLTAGLDFVAGNVIVGGWVGRSRTEATLTGGNVIVAQRFAGDTSGQELFELLQNPSVLSAVCGGAVTPGRFEQSGPRLGGFAGFGFGAGFFDASVTWSRRSHVYSQSVCAIENQDQGDFQRIGFVADTAFDDLDSNGFFNDGEARVAPGRGVLFIDEGPAGLDTGDSVFDDIFAGTLEGDTTIRDLGVSFRTGADFVVGNWLIGPRVTLSITRSETDAYTETGRSSVDNRVVSNPVFSADPDVTNSPLLINDRIVVQRTLGGPIGLELAYEEQSRRSVLLETGGEVAHRIATAFGAIVPHFAGSWRHEFEDDLQIVAARMAQDLRANPVRFTFATDGPDPDSVLFAYGVSALVSDRFVARFEMAHLAYDDLYDVRIATVQARFSF